MALSTGTAGERLYHYFAKVPKSGYTAVAGDLVFADNTLNNAVDLAAQNEAPYGLVASINNANGILSVAAFKSGDSVILPYTGTLALGDKIASNGDRASGGTRTRVIEKNSGGVGSVVALDYPSAGFCVVEF